MANAPSRSKARYTQNIDPTLALCFNVGRPSTTLAKHHTNIEQLLVFTCNKCTDAGDCAGNLTLAHKGCDDTSLALESRPRALISSCAFSQRQIVHVVGAHVLTPLITRQTPAE